MSPSMPRENGGNTKKRARAQVRMVVFVLCRRGCLSLEKTLGLQPKKGGLVLFLFRGVFHVRVNNKKGYPRPVLK